MSKTSPFDFVNSISHTKENLMVGTENDALAEKSYSAWVINTALSNYPDTVLYANEMNLNFFLDNKMQYYYLINSIRPKKRFSKWPKKIEDEDVKLISNFLQCNYKKAKIALRLYNDKQIDEIRKINE